jgi:cytochrome c553
MAHEEWMMKVLTLSVLVVAAGLGAACERSVNAEAGANRTAAAAATASRPQDPRAVVARGRYLIDSIACHDCHTPKKMGAKGPEFDFSKTLAGHLASERLPAPPALPKGPWIAVASWDLTAWSGPWGVSYAINLTPDPDTGIGHWTEKMFVQALRTGKHMGASRPILPPMPWEVYGKLSDDDLKAMFAYLRTVPPISNRVPDPVFATSSH